jgi:hypothetical protein
MLSAEFVKKCSVKDPEFDACVLKNAREAIPHIANGKHLAAPHPCLAWSGRLLVKAAQAHTNCLDFDSEI